MRVTRRVILIAMALVTITMLLLLLGIVSALAEAQLRPAHGAGGFSVRAKLPENAINEDVSYFYLAARPGAAQTLEVEVYNWTDADITVLLEANAAFTNANGVIAYTADGPAARGADFSEMVDIEWPLLAVPANGSATAEFRVSMPSEPIVGEVLGGLVFTKLAPEPEPEARGGGISIAHVFNYCIAVRLRGAQAETLEPEFALHGARKLECAGFPALSVEIENLSPLIIKDAELDIRVYDADMQELLSFEGCAVSMAPSSVMPYTLLMQEAPPRYEDAHRVEVSMRAGGTFFEGASSIFSPAGENLSSEG